MQLTVSELRTRLNEIGDEALVHTSDNRQVIGLTTGRDAETGNVKVLLTITDDEEETSEETPDASPAPGTPTVEDAMAAVAKARKPRTPKPPKKK